MRLNIHSVSTSTKEVFVNWGAMRTYTEMPMSKVTPANIAFMLEARRQNARSNRLCVDPRLDPAAYDGA